MRGRWVGLFLAGMAFAVVAEARPRTAPDRLTQPDPSALTLEQLGPTTLAGIYILDTAEAKRILSAHGETVEAKSLGTDRYGRANAWVYAPGAAQPVQVDMLRAGAALAYDTRALPAAWLAAEKDARAAGRGLWASPPLDAAAIRDEPGKFVRVAGVVTRVYAARDAYYLNFGEDWKTDFSVMIPKRAWRAFGGQPSIAAGARVQVRGALISENGPMLVVTRPEQLEVQHANAR